MRKLYMSAPLPFMGQKRMFVKEFIKVLEQFDDSKIFIDLFGGSGLLSHITKCKRPDATVIYNDFDDYRKRLASIPHTNDLLNKLRIIVKDVPRHKLIPHDIKNEMLACIEQEECCNGFVDYITLSSSVMFSMKYKLNLQEISKESFYNNIRMTDYPLCDDYLDGITVTSCDYKELYNKYKDVQNVVFLVDPPYLSTDVGTYRMYWKLADYLDVLKVLQNQTFVYFTSNKSDIIELCDWIGRNKTLRNPFVDCKKIAFNEHMNFSSGYTDIMLYKNNCA